MARCSLEYARGINRRADDKWVSHKNGREQVENFSKDIYGFRNWNLYAFCGKVSLVNPRGFYLES